MTPTKEETKTAMNPKEIIAFIDNGLKGNIVPIDVERDAIQLIEEYAAQSKPQEPSLPKALEDMLNEKLPYFEGHKNPKTADEKQMNKVVDISNKQRSQERSIATQFYLAGKVSKESETKWIPVEQLPEIEGKWSKEDFLVITPYKYSIGRLYEGLWVDKQNVRIENVTHYQRLPSVPNREK